MIILARIALQFLQTSLLVNVLARFIIADFHSYCDTNLLSAILALLYEIR